MGYLRVHWDPLLLHIGWLKKSLAKKLTAGSLEGQTLPWVRRTPEGKEMPFSGTRQSASDS